MSPVQPLPYGRASSKRLAYNKPITRLLWSALLLAASLHGADTRFSAEKRALAIPFESVDGLVYLDVSVNGTPPLAFILDTGASYTVLSLPRARSFGLGLQPIGKVEGGSGDAPPDNYFITDSVRFALPGVVFSSQGVKAMSFDMLQTCFDKVRGGSASARQPPKNVLAGILGKDFFEQHVVEVDHSRRLINLYDPAGYDYRGEGTTLPLEIGDFIFVQAQIKSSTRRSVAARLIMDTGASAVLTLNKEFFVPNKLLSAAGKLRDLNDCGIGGFAREKSRIGKMRAIQLAGLEVPNPVTVFLQNPEPLEYDGVLGGPSIWNYKVIFDYSRRRMILEPLPRSRVRALQ